LSWYIKNILEAKNIYFGMLIRKRQLESKEFILYDLLYSIGCVSWNYRCHCSACQRSVI